MSSDSIKKFLGLVSNTNKFNLVQVKGGFEVYSQESKSEIIYQVEQKLATTRSHYFIMAAGEKESIAEIQRDQIQDKYTVTQDGEIITTAEFSTKEITLVHKSKKYRSQPKLRSQIFEFLDEKNFLTFTIDKKQVSRKDSYAIAHLNTIEATIPISIALMIDDYYHLGTKGK